MGDLQRIKTIDQFYSAIANNPAREPRQSRLKKLKTTLLLGSFLALCGCTSLSVDSTFLDEETDKADYLAYHLPKSIVKMNVSVDKDNKLVIGKATVEMVADPRAKFRLDFRANAFSDDEFNVDIGANGLLSSATIVNEDKTPDIVSSLTDFIPENFGFERVKVKAEPKPSLSIDLVFDPNDPEQVKVASKKLKSVASNLTLRLKTIEGDYLYKQNNPANLSRSAQFAQETQIARQCDGSLCFRTTRPIIVEITAEKFVSRQVLAIADKSQVSAFDIRRAACVKKTNTITLQNGVLTKADIKKPSEVLGCLSIPADIVKAIFGFPG